MVTTSEAMTPGVLNALNKNRSRAVCACGFPLPVYPGRYPSHCPSCGTDRATAVKQADTSGDEE